MKVDKMVDAKGLACPMPIVRAKKAMDELEVGQILEVHATDAGSEKDVPAWARVSGHQVVKEAKENGIYLFWIEKGGK